MKVGVWLNDNLIPNTGGGFSYTERLIELIDQRNFTNSLNLVFIKCFNKEISLEKEVIHIDINKIRKLNVVQKIIKRLSAQYSVFDKVHKRNINAKNRLVLSEIRNQLEYHKIDVIYYLTQQEMQIRDFPFIATNWDLGHLTMKAFPEVTVNGVFEAREKWYRVEIKKAISIFCDSEAGKKELISNLDIDPRLIKVLPIFAGKVVSLKVTKEKEVSILEKFELINQNYFFYPAQFWEHKNHLNLVKAFKQFSLMYPGIKLVFTGSDKGNLEVIKAYVKNENLNKLVIYLGFVELAEIHLLYKNATALVMPTFLGPTNMPLLEARSLGCPVLCSDFKGHREQLGDGALYFNPESVNEIYNVLIKIMDSKLRQELLKKAKLEEKKSKFNGNKAIEILEQNLIEISELM